MLNQHHSRLHQAIQAHDLIKVKQYIAAGDDLTEIDQSVYPGFSPLDLAAYLGLSEIVGMLLSAGALIDYSHESSPLHQAVSRGHLESAKVLINADADLEFEADDGITPLMEAIERSDLAMVRLLVESGANVEATDRFGRSVLEYARQTGKEILQYLANRINANQQQAFNNVELVGDCVEAIRAGDLNLLKTLIGQGVDINARDNEGYTLLMDAAFYGQTKIVKYLIQLGADVNTIELRGGDTALTHAARTFNWKLVETLLSAGADVNATAGGNKALISAALAHGYGKNESRRIKTIQVLLSSGAILTTEERFIVMDWARKVSDQKLIQLLEQHQNS